MAGVRVSNKSDSVALVKPAKLPSIKELKNVLGTYQFHGAKFKPTQPKELTKSNLLKEEPIVLQKPKKGMVGGTTIRAYLLKTPANSVVFFRQVSGGPPRSNGFMGPVRHDRLPK